MVHSGKASLNYPRRRASGNRVAIRNREVLLRFAQQNTLYEVRGSKGLALFRFDLKLEDLEPQMNADGRRWEEKRETRDRLLISSFICVYLRSSAVKSFHQIIQVIDQQSHLSVVFAVEGEHQPGQVLEGRLVALGKMHATKLGNDREIWIYYPPRYDDDRCEKLPSVVIHDGLESITRGGFIVAADTTYAARPDLSAVLVFVNLPSADVRIDEYSFGTPTAKGMSTRLVRLARNPRRPRALYSSTAKKPAIVK